MSKTVTSLVMVSVSWDLLVRLASLIVPPLLLAVAKLETRVPSPVLSMLLTSPKSSTKQVFPLPRSSRILLRSWLLSSPSVIRPDSSRTVAAPAVFSTICNAIEEPPFQNGQSSLLEFGAGHKESAARADHLATLGLETGGTHRTELKCAGLDMPRHYSPYQPSQTTPVAPSR